MATAHYGQLKLSNFPRNSFDFLCVLDTGRIPKTVVVAGVGNPPPCYPTNAGL